MTYYKRADPDGRPCQRGHVGMVYARTPTAPTRSSRRKARPTGRTSGRGRTAATRRTEGEAARLGRLTTGLAARGACHSRPPRRCSSSRRPPGVLALRDAGDDDAAPTALVDGSTALAGPIGLPRGVRGVVRVRPAEEVNERRLRTCLALVGVGAVPPRTLVVERIGVDGRSLTFREPRAPRLYGCDASARADEPQDGGWCGGAVGTLAGGRLTDARLDLAGCRDGRGQPVAFAWLEGAAPRRSGSPWSVTVGRSTTPPAAPCPSASRLSQRFPRARRPPPFACARTGRARRSRADCSRRRRGLAATRGVTPSTSAFARCQLRQPRFTPF